MSMVLPERVRAGDTWQWKLSSQCFLASDGYQCHVGLKGKYGQYTFSSTPLGSAFNVLVDLDTTKDIVPGAYNYVIALSKNGEQFTAGSGLIVVDVNLFSPGMVDLRDHAEKMLEAIEATLEGRATSDHQEYEILGRKLTRIPVEELMRLRNQYKVEVQNQQYVERLKARGGVAGRIRIRFVS
jgi:hypothetical protein